MSEDEEFTNFFNESYPGLCRFLECLLGGRVAAQDIAQESFLQLYRTGLRNFPAGEARFWLYRVARNLESVELRRTAIQRLSGRESGAEVDELIKIYDAEQNAEIKRSRD